VQPFQPVEQLRVFRAFGSQRLQFQLYVPHFEEVFVRVHLRGEVVERQIILVVALEEVPECFTATDAARSSMFEESVSRPLYQLEGFRRLSEP